MINCIEKVLETDILGDCETVYEPISKRYATFVIQKSKALNKCKTSL